MTALSWQPPPVTKCNHCKFAMHELEICGAETPWLDKVEKPSVYLQNKDGITPTCPMWQQQNK